MQLSQPPAHLSPKAVDFRLSTVERFELEDHHLMLLERLCEALDMGEEARKILAADGLTVEGHRGPRAHPMCAVARDARRSGKAPTRA